MQTNDRYGLVNQHIIGFEGLQKMIDMVWLTSGQQIIAFESLQKMINSVWLTTRLSDFKDYRK